MKLSAAAVHSAPVQPPSPIPPSTGMVRGRSRPGRADPDPGRVQLRLAGQFQLQLQHGTGGRA
jgi:hypothetical protein